ncbi:MAG TPA: alpha/beta hydrolase [Planctomycetota bacterium]|nr:alpha/beta hydrolase [Planctomycetota bacterium]
MGGDAASKQFRQSEQIYKRVGDVALAMHIFQPADARPSDRRGAIVFFFGGGWRSGSPDSFFPYCERLAERGFVAMAADYRVEERHATRPLVAVQDAKSAMRWVRRNAATLGIDPARLAAGGGSAGGHLALCCLLCEAGDEPGEDTSVSAVPCATATINPVADITAFKPGLERCASPEEARAISPALHVHSGCGPSILFHGEKDELVPLPSVQTFGAAMRAAGNRFEVVVRPGQAHGFYKFKEGKNPEFFVVAEGIERFLAEVFQ